MANLQTTYLKLPLKNPLIVGASPLSGNLDNLKKMEEAGAAAIVLPSLFEEQIQMHSMGLSQFPPQSEEDLPAALQNIPQMDEYNRGASGYLAYLYQARQAVSVPIIASLNGYYGGGWVQYARLIEAAQAHALELNVYYLPTKPHITGSELEEMYLKLVHDIRANISIPVAVKLSPYFSALTNMAQKFETAGANGLVLFNRFYQPEIDPETKTAEPTLELSTPAELRLRLRWIGILRSQVKMSLCVTGGIHSGTDMLKGIMAGADAVMTVSALYKQGIGQIRTMLDDLENWLDTHEYNSLAELHASVSRDTLADSAAFERANYMTVISSQSSP
ncbi:MAG: dihydroorotate dehydrogenase-like protein [Chloroflexota bacterium]|jgi:dihydroorotate dehydrogenase (fumarate)